MERTASRIRFPGMAGSPSGSGPLGPMPFHCGACPPLMIPRPRARGRVAHGGLMYPLCLGGPALGHDRSTRGEVVDALRDLARGAVHRSRHVLVLDDVDYTADFEGVLRSEHYTPARLGALTVPRGM